MSNCHLSLLKSSKRIRVKSRAQFQWNWIHIRQIAAVTLKNCSTAHICAIEIHSHRYHTTTTATVRFPHFPLEFFIAILPNPHQYTHILAVRESQQPRSDERIVSLCVFDTHVQYLRHRRNSASDIFLCKYARWYVPKRQPKKHKRRRRRIATTGEHKRKEYTSIHAHTRTLKERYTICVNTYITSVGMGAKERELCT